MFSYFKGTIEKKYKDKIVIDVGNIGYEIYMPNGDIESLREKQEVKINTFTDIKEGYLGIFGFLSEESLSVFEKLKKVSGIGSKSALGILSHMSPNDICIAIANEDATLLNKIPGIGVKTAARIILELKDKILKEGGANIIKSGTKVSKTNSEENEAMLALKVLGYTTLQIKDAMDKLEIEGLRVEEIIKKVLNSIN